VTVADPKPQAAGRKGVAPVVIISHFAKCEMCRLAAGLLPPGLRARGGNTSFVSISESGFKPPPTDRRAGAFPPRGGKEIKQSQNCI
jgi:hypothetical protein